MSVFFYLGISDLVHFYDNSLDNSSSAIFQVFAYDQYSQLQHRVIRTLSLDVSSQEASSEEISITLLASMSLEFHFGEMLARSSQGALWAKQNTPALMSREITSLS